MLLLVVDAELDQLQRLRRAGRASAAVERLVDMRAPVAHLVERWAG